MITINKLHIKTFVLAGVLAFSHSIGCVRAANDIAKPVSLKIGYFNLALAKLLCPAAAETEALKNQAEAQLKGYIEDANKRMQKAQEEKKSDAELSELKKTLQTEVSAKQQALAQLIQSSNAMANSKIMGAANQVAKEKGLDLVIDGAGIYAGGQKVLDNGLDVTKNIIKILAPNQEINESKPVPAKKPATK